VLPATSRQGEFDSHTLPPLIEASYEELIISSKDVKKILREELPNLTVKYGVKKIGLL